MNFADLAQKLSGAGAHAWTLAETCVTSRQRYHAMGHLEAQREVATREVKATLITRREERGATVQGEASFILTGDTFAPSAVDAQIKDALERSALIANPLHEVPEAAPSAAVSLCDARVAGMPWEVLAEQEKIVAGAAEGTTVAALELFADRRDVRVATSGGFSGSYEATELFCEFVLMAGSGSREVECLGIARARRPEELELAHLVERHGHYVRDLLAAGAPHTGKMPVVFGGEALDTLFDSFAAHADARARYEGWSRAEAGRPVIGNASGDLISLTIDPLRAWRMDSRPFDLEWQCGRPVVAIENGVWRDMTAAKRHADYLKIPATGNGGNRVVAPGATPLAELLAEGPVLYALRFSTFQPNPVTGAFSGELRTAYLHDGTGTVTPITGGSVSGNVFTAFANARFSSETAIHPGYEGPAGVRLEQVTVAGPP